MRISVPLINFKLCPALDIKEALEQRIAAALKAPGRAEGVRKIAKKLGVNASTVQSISREIVA